MSRAQYENDIVIIQDALRWRADLAEYFHRLYDQLVADVQTVVDTLTIKDSQVQTTDGLWYLMRIRPYRTLDNIIGGAVITFVDITAMKRLEDSLEKANKELRRLAVVVHDASDAVTVHDLDGRILAWNPAATRLYGWSEGEALRMNERDRIPQGLREDSVVGVDNLGGIEGLQPQRTRRLTKDGTVLDVWMTATALVDASGQVYAVATTERASESSMDGAGG